MSGVDLNRNYGIHQEENQEEKEECSESFRGDGPFSEPETKSIQYFLEKYSNITSCMNFHAYGNMLIHPFNYMSKEGLYPRNIE